MMKKLTSALLLMSITLLLLSNSLQLKPATAIPLEETSVNNKYMGSITGNQTHQFKFQNQFQFRIRTNTSLYLNMSCDCDQIMARNMTMFLNTTQSRSLTMMVNGSHEALGLVNGAPVLTWNEEQYRFTEGLVMSLDLNGTGPLQAELRINATNPEAQWAYYDENSHKFVTTPTIYQDGQLCTQTDHFSLWTLLTPPTPRNETVETKFQGSIDANTTNQFTFQNQFQYQIRTNRSLDLDLECDTENVQMQTMTMNMNTTETLQMRIRFNATLPEVGLYNGSIVRNTTQARYRYQECLILNITLNNTVPIQAQLRITNEFENATWAYYDDIEEEWIPVQTRYENGEWVADVTHFSLWTLLLVEDISETTTSPSIAAYPGIFIIGLFCVVSLVLYRRRK